MTVLSTEQTKSLTSSIMAKLVDNVDAKLKELRTSKEWTDAVEEGKKDEQVLESVQSNKEYLEKQRSLYELKQQVQELDSNYDIMWSEDEYNGCYTEIAHFSNLTDEEIQKRSDEELERQSTHYAKNKTGIVDHWYQWGSIYSKIVIDLEARISVTNLDNYDSIINGTLQHFDVDSIVNDIREYEKTTPSCEPCCRPKGSC